MKQIKIKHKSWMAVGDGIRAVAVFDNNEIDVTVKKEYLDQLSDTNNYEEIFNDNLWSIEEKIERKLEKLSSIPKKIILGAEDYDEF